MSLRKWRGGWIDVTYNYLDIHEPSDNFRVHLPQFVGQWLSFVVGQNWGAMPLLVSACRSSCSLPSLLLAPFVGEGKTQSEATCFVFGLRGWDICSFATESARHRSRLFPQCLNSTQNKKKEKTTTKPCISYTSLTQSSGNRTLFGYFLIYGPCPNIEL